MEDELPQALKGSSRSISESMVSSRSGRRLCRALGTGTFVLRRGDGGGDSSSEATEEADVGPPRCITTRSYS